VFFRERDFQEKLEFYLPCLWKIKEFREKRGEIRDKLGKEYKPDQIEDSSSSWEGFGIG
jgi:hypothetical protein